MSRIDGFDIMDVSTAILHDPKFIRLGREYPAIAGAGFTAYLSVTAESWKAGTRLSIDEAWPVMLAFDDAVPGALRAVRLLDQRGRVTTSAWRGFFEQARARREKSRERWRRANDKREAKPDDLNGNHRADTSRSPRGAHAVTASLSDSVRPSESVRVSSRESQHAPEANDRATLLTKKQLEAWSSFGREWHDVKAAWLERGLRRPPTGDADDETSQRALLYEILDARPSDLVRWIRDAPKKLRSDELVGHVLARWKAVKAELEQDDDSPWRMDPSPAEAAATLAEIGSRVGR